MSAKRTLSDIEINAYLDGELADREREDLEALIAEDPAVEARLAAYQTADDQLRAALDPITGEGVPPHLLNVLLAEPRRMVVRLRWAAAATIAIFLLGGLAGWFYAQNDRVVLAARDTATQAQTAHRVYVSEVRHPVEVEAAEYDHLVGWLSKRLGHPLVAPDFGARDFHLIGGRLLPGAGMAAAQFMYENKAGERITFYIAQNPGAAKTAFRLSEVDTVRTFYWLDGPFGYAISGTIGEATMLDLAHLAYSQISPDGEPPAGEGGA